MEFDVSDFFKKRFLVDDGSRDDGVGGEEVEVSGFLFRIFRFNFRKLIVKVLKFSKVVKIGKYFKLFVVLFSCFGKK